MKNWHGYHWDHVKDTSSGTFKNILVERIDSIETTLALYIVPEFTSNLLAPVIILIFFPDRLEAGTLVLSACCGWISFLFWHDA